jgi:DNA-binding response OmpR family regulator
MGLPFQGNVQPMSYQFEKLTVLIVESNHAMFDLTKGVLSSFGIGRIISAYDTKNGFREFQLSQPDLVIVDWLADESSGLDLTRKIRTSPDSPNPYVPIIMMTGYSQKKRVIMARDSGVSEFVVKPYTASTLYKKIETIIEQPRQFIKAPNFFGPDRRRKSNEFTGKDRRKSKARPRRASDVAREITKKPK